MTIAPVADPTCVAHGEVAVDGGVLPIAIAGDGPPVILLHGWTLDHRMWAPQVDGLAGDFLLIAPDRRGCGRATASADLAREADDVIAIADFLGFDRFALVGLSQGATVALDVARKFGSRLSGLVVSGVPLPALVARDEAIDLSRFRTLAAGGDLERMRAEWSRHPLMQTHSPAARSLVLDMLADYDGRDLGGLSDPPGLPHEVLRALAVPVLALAGEHDTPWRQACARALCDVAPRAMHAVVPGAGHLANADNPARFNALVASFLKSCADPKKRA